MSRGIHLDATLKLGLCLIRIVNLSLGDSVGLFRSSGGSSSEIVDFGLGGGCSTRD